MSETRDAPPQPNSHVLIPGKMGAEGSLSVLWWTFAPKHMLGRIMVPRRRAKKFVYSKRSLQSHGISLPPILHHGIYVLWFRYTVCSSFGIHFTASVQAVLEMRFLFSPHQSLMRTSPMVVIEMLMHCWKSVFRRDDCRKQLLDSCVCCYAANVIWEADPTCQ